MATENDEAATVAGSTASEKVTVTAEVTAASAAALVGDTPTTSGGVRSGSSVVNVELNGAIPLPAPSAIPPVKDTMYPVSWLRLPSGSKVADLRLPATVTVPTTGPPLATRNVPVVTVSASIGFENCTVTLPPTGTSPAAFDGDTEVIRGGAHSMGMATSTVLSIGRRLSAMGSRMENVIVAMNSWPMGVSASMRRSQSAEFSPEAPGAKSGKGDLML